MSNENLKNILNSVEEDMDLLLDPVKLTKHDMGELFTEFVGYDPTTYWDHEIMMDQMIKLTETDGEILSMEDREEAVDAALEHFDAIKPSVMLQIAQKTVKSMFDKEVTSDDLGLDLEYLMNSEIFGTGYDESDEDEEDSSLLDELNDEDDDIDPEDEEDLVD